MYMDLYRDRPPCKGCHPSVTKRGIITINMPKELNWYMYMDLYRDRPPCKGCHPGVTKRGKIWIERLKQLNRYMDPGYALMFSA